MTITGWEWWSLAGGLLEMAGLGLVVRGIDKRQREAGRLGVLAALRDWITSITRNLLIRLKIIKPASPEHEAITSVDLAASANSVVMGSAAIEGSVQEQLSQLRSQVQIHRLQITALETGLATEIKDREEGDRAEQESRESALKHLRSTLTSVVAGDLGLEAGGVVLFVAGVALQTVGSITP